MSTTELSGPFFSYLLLSYLLVVSGYVPDLSVAGQGQTRESTELTSQCEVTVSQNGTGYESRCSLSPAIFFWDKMPLLDQPAEMVSKRIAFMDMACNYTHVTPDSCSRELFCHWPMGSSRCRFLQDKTGFNVLLLRACEGSVVESMLYCGSMFTNKQVCPPGLCKMGEFGGQWCLPRQMVERQANFTYTLEELFNYNATVWGACPGVNLTRATLPMSYSCFRHVSQQSCTATGVCTWMGMCLLKDLVLMRSRDNAERAAISTARARCDVTPADQCLMAQITITHPEDPLPGVTLSPGTGRPRGSNGLTRNQLIAAVCIPVAVVLLLALSGAGVMCMKRRTALCSRVPNLTNTEHGSTNKKAVAHVEVMVGDE